MPMIRVRIQRPLPRKTHRRRPRVFKPFTLRVSYAGFDTLIDRLISQLVMGDPHAFDSGYDLTGKRRDLFFDFETRAKAADGRSKLKGFPLLKRRITKVRP